MEGNIYFLGIDVGTSSAKSTVVANQRCKATAILGSCQEPYDYNGGCLSATSSCSPSSDTKAESLDNNTTAESGDDISRLFHEQSAEVIINSVCRCIRQSMDIINANSSTFELELVAICGQMHGVIMWSRGTKIIESADKSYKIVGSVSNLITWQDQRCSSQFLRTLPKCGGPISTGYGCASLFWLATYRPDYIEQFSFAGSIADFVIAMLCDLPAVVMSDHNAASWGYYDIESGQWQHDVLSDTCFPLQLLPTVVPAGQNVGKTTHSWSGLPPDIAVYVACGDAQCSVMSTQCLPHQAVLNMGTSCQLSFSSNTTTTHDHAHLQRWPYTSDGYLCFIASLNGGNVIANFVQMLKRWITDLGMDVPEDHIWSKLSSMTNTEDNRSELSITPTIYKERGVGTPHTGASVSNILCDNLSLSHVYQQTCVGIVKNIYDMLPAGVLSENGITQILCTGSIFTRHPFMLSAVRQVFASLSDVDTCTQVDAAYGAILMTNSTL